MLFYHVLPRWNCMVASFVCFCFCFLVLGRSADIFFCDCTHSCSIKNFKKNVKKRKKGKTFQKKINSYTLFSMCGWVPRFSMFLVYFWFVEVSKQVVCWTSFKRQTTQLGLDHYLFPSVVIRWSHVHDRSVAINVPFL